MKYILRMMRPMIGKWGYLWYVIMGIVSGLLGFLFINLVTRVIGLIIAGKFTNTSKEYVIIFALIILFYVWIRRVFSLSITRLSQRILWRLRKEIISLALNANYQQLSGRKREVQSTIVTDVYVLTDSAMNLISFLTSLILAVACLVYLATISFLLFSITLGVAVLGAGVYFISSSKTNAAFEKFRSLESKFLGNLTDILDGYKEIYMEPKKGQYIFENKITAIAEESYGQSMTAFTRAQGNQLIGQILSYLLIGSILLYFSVQLNLKIADTVSFIFILLYLQNAIEAIMMILPGLMRAKVAAKRLLGLKKELEDANFDNPMPDRYISKKEFEQLSIRDLCFNYGDKAFGIGPVNFDLKKGDIAFIYGGNGTGKTTFVHSVLGLCIPVSGELKMNETLVTKESYKEYRTLFTVVFSDFYLFTELLAMEHFNSKKWHYYLQLFEIEGKVKLENNRFSTTDLSAGQRKRLALIVALLEEKPILVIDEWAADQDPYFRNKFYTEIIPLLKEDGFTIIAITHDDKYYSCADKIYKMEYGNLIEETHEAHKSRLVSVRV